MLSPGKKVEKQVQTWLDAKSNSDFTFAYHRFPDAKAARGALSAQPADWLVAYRGIGFLLEAKETAQLKRLPKDKISQYGKLRLFHEAGFTIIVLVYMSAHNHWVYLTGPDLFKDEVCPASFLLNDKKIFSDADSALRNIFGE